MNLKTSLDEKKKILFVPALAWYFVSAGFSLPDKMSIAWCFQNVQWNNHNKQIFENNNAKNYDLQF